MFVHSLLRLIASKTSKVRIILTISPLQDWKTVDFLHEGPVMAKAFSSQDHGEMCITLFMHCHHQYMMTSSNGNIFLVTGPLCGEVTRHRWISPRKGQRHGAVMFSLIFAWTNGRVNNRDASDLRRQSSRHHAHYDVTVMEPICNHGCHFISPYCQYFLYVRWLCFVH